MGIGQGFQLPLMENITDSMIDFHLKGTISYDMLNWMNFGTKSYHNSNIILSKYMGNHFFFPGSLKIMSDTIGPIQPVIGCDYDSRSIARWRVRCLLVLSTRGFSTDHFSSMLIGQRHFRHMNRWFCHQPGSLRALFVQKAQEKHRKWLNMEKWHREQWFSERANSAFAICAASLRYKWEDTIYPLVHRPGGLVVIVHSLIYSLYLRAH